jgi:hypothetical protein
MRDADLVSLRASDVLQCASYVCVVAVAIELMEAMWCTLHKEQNVICDELIMPCGADAHLHSGELFV